MLAPYSQKTTPFSNRNPYNRLTVQRAVGTFTFDEIGEETFEDEIPNVTNRGRALKNSTFDDRVGIGGQIFAEQGDSYARKITPYS